MVLLLFENTGYIKFVLSCASLIASFLLSFCRDIESRSRKSDESSFSFLIDDDERFNNESLARYTSAMSEIVFFRSEYETETRFDDDDDEEKRRGEKRTKTNAKTTLR